LLVDRQCITARNSATVKHLRPKKKIAKGKTVKRVPQKGNLLCTAHARRITKKTKTRKKSNKRTWYMFETRATFHPPMFWLNGSASKNICHTQIAKRKKKGKKKSKRSRKKKWT
jgi:hypothetical protein